jgi:hypothetical protein
VLTTEETAMGAMAGDIHEVMGASEINALRAAVAARFDTSPTSRRLRHQDPTWRLLATLEAALALLPPIADGNPMEDDWTLSQITVPYALVEKAQALLGRQ